MYSDQELDEREFQLELIDRQIAADSTIAVSLALFAVATSFVITGVTICATGVDYSFWGLNLMWYCYAGSVVLSYLSLLNTGKYLNEKRWQKREILDKYVYRHRATGGKNDV